MSTDARKYLQSVAHATHNKLLDSAVGKKANVAVVEDLSARNSGTGGWRVRLGSVANGNVELQVWYDKFIGNSQRRLWIGLYSRLAENIEPYLNQKHFDIGDDDIVRDSDTGE